METMETTTRVEVERFDGTGDFSLWKIRMMAHFGVMGLKEMVMSDDFTKAIPAKDLKKKGIEIKSMDSPSKPVEGLGIAMESADSCKTQEDEVIIDHVKLKKNDRARNMIILNIGDRVLRKIKHCETAAAMWLALDRLYVSKSLPNLIFIQSQFYTFKCEASKSVGANFDEFLRIVAEMSTLNVNVTDEIQAIVFLNSLPSSFDQLKHTLTEVWEDITGSRGSYVSCKIQGEGVI